MNLFENKFIVEFRPVSDGRFSESVSIYLNGDKVGDYLNDNSYQSDGYRFHDVMHFSFGTILGWSPCLRSILKKKRKYDPLLDEFEDGARAGITEESISLILFSMYKENDFEFCQEKFKVIFDTCIHPMTKIFEVKIASYNEWELASKTGLGLFKALIDQNGGSIVFDPNNKTGVLLSA